MFSTYNESSLHRTLKIWYAERSNGKTEQEVEGKICDIVAENGEIIEIQTGSLAKLAAKIALLAPRHKMRVVYPLVTEKYIELYDEAGTLLLKRKSPKKRGIYSIFRELTGIYPWLCHENFSLETLEVTVTEKRIRTAEPVQLANKSRRWLKNWYRADKELRTMENSRVFSCTADYAALLDDIPVPAGGEFSRKTLAASGARADAALMLWVLQKLGVVAHTGKKGNAKQYARATK
jgi:hypothetical protein